MNQILYTSNNIIIDNLIEETPSPLYKKRVFLFKFQIYLSLVIAICLLIFYFYSLYETIKQEKLSQNLINNFNISRLYSNSSIYSIEPAQSNSSLFSVIGIIEIDKINLNYPILSTISDELLKIAPCKFYGPDPNEIGNLCIAAHNYNNYKFFSKVRTLEVGDIITIYDLNSKKLKYSVYDKKQVLQTDISVTSQDTNGSKEITLVTCNNIQGKRIIVKAREI